MKFIFKRVLSITFIFYLMFYILTGCIVKTDNNNPSLFTPKSPDTSITGPIKTPLSFNEILDFIGLEQLLTFTKTQLSNDVLSLSKGIIKAHEKVWVTVKVSDDSVVGEYLKQNSYNSVADYAISLKGLSLINNMHQQQNSVKAKLSAIFDVEYKHSYTTLLNGFSACLPYGQIALLKAVDGVEGVYLSEEYHMPEATVDEQAIFSEGGIFTNDSSFQGEKMLVAIIDTGINYHHASFRTELTNVAYTKEQMNTLVNQGVLKGKYYNSKIAYGYDYADLDTDVYPLNSHGTHIAGILAGDDQCFSGVAPKAQLAIMKVFSNETEGALTIDIIKALGDCVLLGVDAINLSLGIPVGYSKETGSGSEYINKIYNQLDDLGIVVCCSAGNTYNMGLRSPYGGTLPSNPDNGVVSSPGSYYPNLSVSSINNYDSYYLLGNNSLRFNFNNAVGNDSEPYDFLAMFIDSYGVGIYDYVTVPGIGEETDYVGIDVGGKIALIERGIISFEEKQRIAHEQGAIAAVIYNNQDNEINMQITNLVIPSVSVSKKIGNTLATIQTGTISISYENTYGKLISDFSSLGPVGDLSIKPEITAPGGRVLSSYNDGYESMSGTSMSSPNIAGLTLVLKQALLTKYPEYTNTKIKTMINQLLMSTTKLIIDENGNPVLVRKQGSGLANVNKALNTLAYLTVTGSDKTKLELGDDPNETGRYCLSFNLVNTSNKALSYDLSTLTMTDSLNDNGLTVKGVAHMLNQGSVDVYVGGILQESKEVTVFANSLIRIKVIITLSEEEKTYIRSSFENGMYVEGFVTLEAKEEEGINLNLPWLAFFGDWTKAKIFDSTIFDNQDPVQYDILPLGIFAEEYYLPLGMYVFNLPEGYEAIASNEKYASVSIFTDAISSFYSVYFGLLRNVSGISYVFTDANTGEVLYQYIGDPHLKTYYNVSADNVIISADEIDFNTYLNHLYNNCEIKLTMTAYLDYEAREATDTITIQYTIDYEQPKLIDSSFYTKDGMTYLELEVYDNQYLQAIQLMTLDASQSSWIPLDLPFPAIDFKKGYANIITIDLTPYLDDINNEALGLYLYDFAMNPAAYELEFNTLLPDNPMLPPIPNIPIEENDFVIDGDNLISYNGSQTEILVPSRVKSIFCNAFSNSNVNYIWFENGSMLEEVKDNAFSNSHVKGVYFHNTNLNRISNDAFCFCFELEEVYFPESLTELGDNIFVECPILSYLNLEYTSIQLLPNHLVMNNNELTSITIPDSVSIVRNSFDRCIGLTSIRMLSVAPPMMEGEFIEGEYNPDLVIYVPNGTIDTYLFAEGWRELISRGIMIMEEEIIKSSGVNINDYTINDGLSYIPNYKKNGITTYSESDFTISETGVLLSYLGPGGDITLPSNVLSINQNVFYGNQSITSVTIQEGCISIGRQAFRDCLNLKKVVLPTSITSLNTYTFGNCQSLADINLENTSIKVISTSFENCFALTKIGIPKTAVKLSYAFAECQNLKTIYFYSTDVTTNDSAFIRNTNPTSFFVPYAYGNAYKLAWPTFAHCIYEMEPNIPDGMVIENGVLLGYEGPLTILPIPIIVTSIADGALSNKNLTKVVFESRDLTSIGSYAFSGNHFTEIDLTKTSVVSIGDGAFEDCSELEKVILPINTLKTLGSSTFKNCILLNNINIFDTKVASYEASLFENTGLTWIVIPKTVLTIHELALSTDALKIVEIISNTPCLLADNAFLNNNLVIYVPTNTSIIYKETRNWVNYANLIREYQENSDFDIVNNQLIAYLGSSKIVVIPQNVTSIANQVFLNNLTIEQVIFPDQLTSIGNEAFYGCSNLRLINMINSSVVDIGSKAFYNCTKLENVKLPNTVYFIGSYAFYGCAEMKYINLQNTNIQTLSYGLFQGCTGLLQLTIPASVMTIESYSLYISTYTTTVLISLPKLPPVLHANVFMSPISLYFKVFVSPGSAEAYINSSGWGIVRQCIVEREEFIIKNGILIEYIGSGGIIEIPSTVTTIGDEVFKDNLEVTNVIIPSTVTNIGNHAFMNAANLSKLEMRGSVPAEIGIDAFKGVNFKLINIPTGSLDVYQTAWREYVIYLVELDVFNIVNGILVGYYGSDAVVTIPDGVYSVGSLAFNQNSLLTEIYFPTGITRIEDKAFIGCENLIIVALPDTLTYIGSNAFYGTLSINRIILPTKVEYLGSNAFAYSGIEYIDMSLSQLRTIENNTFQYCRSLKEVILPQGLTMINNNAFIECHILESVNFESTLLTNIGYKAFYRCNLLNINFPNTLTRIEKEAFMYNNGLYEIIFSTSLNYIGEYSFHFCQFVKKIDLSNTKLCEIGRGAFSEMPRVSEINFPNTLVIIREEAFLSCNNLKAIEIPSSVNMIGNRAFAQNSNLTYIYLPSTIETIESQAFDTDGAERGKPRIVYLPGKEMIRFDTPFIQIFHYQAELEVDTYFIVDDSFVDIYKNTLEIQENMAIIGVSEMYTINDGTLTSYNGPEDYVVIPYGVTMIGESVFKDYNKMKEVYISNSVNVIEDYAFKGCSSLTKLHLGKGLQYIGKEAFANCQRLSDVRVVSEISFTIGKDVFKNTYSDMVIFVPQGASNDYQNAWGWKSYANQILEASDFYVIGNILVEYSGNPTGEVVVPNGVLEIDDKVFLSYLIKKVILPEGLTSLGYGTFQMCYNLETIELPTTLLTIKELAFYNCKELTNIDFNDGLLSIGNSAFAYCDSLIEIVVPSSVVSIGSNAFSRMEKVETIIVNANLTKVYGSLYYEIFCRLPSLTTIIFNGNIGDIDGMQFYDCKNLKTVIFNGTVNSINYTSFTSLPKLEEVYFNNDVGEILEYAFNSNPLLNKVVFGGNLGKIGPMTFGNCGSLTKWEITPENEYLTIIDNILYDKEITRIYRQPAALLTNEIYFVPETVKIIDPYAFSYYELIANNVPIFYEIIWIVMTSTINVENHKFKEIYFTNDIETIGEYAFSYHQNLEQVVFDESIENEVNIMPYAFYGCQFFHSVIMPKKLGDCDLITVFGACPLLKNIVFPEDDNKFTIIDNVIYSIDMKILIKFLNDEVDEFIIPEGVVKIGASAFINTISLTKVTFPSTLKVIGDKAFYGCNNLTTYIFMSHKAPILETYIDQTYAYYYANFITYLEELSIELTLYCLETSELFDSYIYSLYFDNILSLDYYN